MEFIDETPSTLKEYLKLLQKQFFHIVNMIKLLKIVVII